VFDENLATAFFGQRHDSALHHVAMLGRSCGDSFRVRLVTSAKNA
jgi:hypothetical protein